MMKSKQVVLALASLLSLGLCLEHAEEAPDRFIVKFEENLDYWIRPYKLYEIWVPASSIPANEKFHIR
jgi:hypothetical protein